MANIRTLRKEKTRAKLLEAAAGLIKESGMKDASVQQVMSKAKLTHGAFYAYFRDKDQMIVQAFRWALDQSLAQVKNRIPPQLKAQERLKLFLQNYLSPRHRGETAQGCPIAALARDFSRTSPRFRSEFSDGLNTMIEERRKLFSDPAKEMPRAEWIGVMSCYVGALLLSRACEGQPLSDEILTGALDYLTQNSERQDRLP